MSEEWGFAVVRRRNEYKNRNFAPPTSFAYIFWRGTESHLGCLVKSINFLETKGHRPPFLQHFRITLRGLPPKTA